MHLNELKALHVSEVLKQAEELEIENTGRMRKQELMFAIIKKTAHARGIRITTEGVVFLDEFMLQFKRVLKFALIAIDIGIT